jgi:type II secretory ATPase GspE/PulE/Tfp pilus assembly ATPase PilB-like protein
MVGEIRDPETAQTAIRASQTGHLVLSTLHTNSAPAAVQRLVNLEIRPNDISSAMNMVISQRLVRVLCEHCKEPAKLSAAQRKKVKKELKNIPKKIRPDFDEIQFYKPQGCNKCGPSGYKGQTGVFEIMFNTDELSELISKKAPTSKIKKSALKQGMLTVREDAILKAAAGTTSLSEVERIS